MEQENNRSMMIVLVAGIILVLVVLFFIQMGNNSSDNQSPATTTTTAGDTDGRDNNDEDFVTSFSLVEQNDSGQNGTVALTEVGNQVRVVLTLTDPVSTSEPAHIHTGRCPSPGGIVFELDPVVNGTSTTTLNTTLTDLRARGDLAVNVHKSEAESGVYYSCADLNI